MTLSRSELTEAIDSNLAELREGVRAPSSKFRLRCTHCGNLIDRGLSVEDRCPLLSGRCSGVLELNPQWKP